MDTILLLTLLAVTAALVLAMFIVLVIVLVQGRRIAKLARQTQELAQQVEEQNKSEPPPGGDG